jgi:hypothetical protein
LQRAFELPSDKSGPCSFDYRAGAVSKPMQSLPIWRDGGRGETELDERIAGTVKDPTGASLSGTSVAAVNAPTGAKQEAPTNDKGVYSFPALSVGQHTLEIRAPGLKTYRKTGLAIDVNSALQEDVRLQLGGQSTAVEVTEDATQVQVEKSDTQLGQTITSQRITEVPLHGRSYTDLLAVQTGSSHDQRDVQHVVRRRFRRSRALRRTESRIVLRQWPAGIGERVHSQRRQCAGGCRKGRCDHSKPGFTRRAPRPHQQRFDAEYGNYLRGWISVVTRSGTNQLHGSAFEFLRNTDLDARGFFDPSRGPDIQNQFGGTIGGPIKKGTSSSLATTKARETFRGLKPDCFPSLSFTDRSGNLSDLARSLTGTGQ